MGLFDKLFRRGKQAEEADDDTPIVLDKVARAPQLLRLEKALDALANEMRGLPAMNNPGWRGRVNEYSMLAGDAMQLRRGPCTREGVLDLVFSARPVFSAEIPPGMESIGPLQTEVMAAAEDLRAFLPGEHA